MENSSVDDANSPVGDANSPVDDANSPVGVENSSVDDANSPVDAENSPVDEANSRINDADRIVEHANRLVPEETGLSATKKLAYSATQKPRTFGNERAKEFSCQDRGDFATLPPMIPPFPAAALDTQAIMRNNSARKCGIFRSTSR